AVSDPGNPLAHLPDGPPYAWIRHGEGLVGWGEAARTVVPPGPGRFERAREWLASLFGEGRIDDEVGAPGSGPVAFGLFTFDGDAVGSTLVVPRIVLARRDGLAWLTTIDAAGRETDVLDFPPAEP